MKQLTLIYLALAVIAVALIQAPKFLPNPEFRAKTSLEPNEAIADGSLILVSNEKLYVSREVPQGKTIRWRELSFRPTSNPSPGQVPIAIDVKRSEASEMMLSQGRKLMICPGNIPGEFQQLECGVGVEDCIAILRVSKEGRTAVDTLAEPTLNLSNDCG